MQQTKFSSFIESLTNIAIGYSVALASQLVIFPQFDIHVSLQTNIYIGLWFTLVSIIRSYVIRRWFNKQLFKKWRAMHKDTYENIS